MTELIFLFIFAVSVLGLGIIFYRKIPLIPELTEVAPLQTEGINFSCKIKKLCPFKGFSFDVFLQKVLSKARILTLKTDNKTSSWLQKLREKAQKDKIKENDNYWQEIKKKTKE